MCRRRNRSWHSEVIFVSDHPKGPYLPANNNPILTQRYFPANRTDKVDWAGHADLVEGPDGKYYGVFLGIRPNEKNRVNTGRETFYSSGGLERNISRFREWAYPYETYIEDAFGSREPDRGKRLFA